MVSALLQFDMNGVLKTALIALVVVIAAVLLVACPDGLCLEYEHGCCSGAVQSGFFQRLVRGLKHACLALLGPVLAWLHLAARRASEWYAWLPSAQPTLEASPLRI